MYATLGNFEYHEPQTVEDALRLLADLGSDAMILAGGCELIPELRTRRIAPRAVVSIAHIAGLNEVRLSDGELVIGALASLRAVEQCIASADDLAVLHEGICSIASVQLRNSATLVGNLCVATPASDIATPLIVLGAEMHVASKQGTRTLPVFDLFRSAKQNSLCAGELVLEVRVKRSSPGTGSAFAKLTRTAADCAKLNAAGAVVVEGGLCADVRLALGAVAATPVRAERAEEYLRGRKLESSAITRAAAIAAEDVNPITDIRSTAEYRRETTRVLVERVLSRGAERATRRES